MVMSHQYIRMGEHERAISMLYQLMQNIKERCIDKIEKGRRLPTVIYNLTKALGEVDRREEAIRLCDEGKEVCLETGFLRMLPVLMGNKAFSLLARGKKDECVALLIDIHHTLKLSERYDEIKLLKDYAAERGIIL